MLVECFDSPGFYHGQLEVTLHADLDTALCYFWNHAPPRAVRYRKFTTCDPIIDLASYPLDSPWAEEILLSKVIVDIPLFFVSVGENRLARARAAFPPEVLDLSRPHHLVASASSLVLIHTAENPADLPSTGLGRR